MQKISVLTQYLGNLTNFDSKLRLTKYVQSAIFQNFYYNFENFGFLVSTKMFNLKNHESIIHLLDSSRYDNQFCGSGASEAPAQA